MLAAEIRDEAIVSNRHTEGVMRNRKKIMDNKIKDEIKNIICLSEVNGGYYWARHDGNIHAPYGFSTIDVLNTLGDIGLHAADSKIVLDAIEFIFTYFDEKGCFKYSPKSSKLPCITALILTAFGRLGYKKDKRIQKCYQYLLETQQKDGGWRCNTVKLGKSPATDSSNPGTTLYVLDAFRFKTNIKDYISQLDKGVLFLLKHWDTRTPLGPCEFGIGKRFLSIEYPFLRYNLFYYVYVLSKYNSAHKDERYKDALNTLIMKTRDNKIFPETPHKSWQQYSFAQKNKYSEIATKRFKEIMSI
ncbi:MAG: hypothetical protein JW925_12835 [Syntrophaceae bacterium]|nr:hypothetical protein [Syntrophaceae bacterium]